MPLKPSQILALLQAKQAEFQNFDHQSRQLLQQYRQGLTTLGQRSSEVVTQQLQEIADPGARPLESWAASPNWLMDFEPVWQSREQSLAWVRDRLLGISTFAVDGSQIYPSKDLSIPVALVQIGWFENSHHPNGSYEKDIAVDILTPSDLQVSNSGELAERQVNMRRFEMETERLIQYMANHAGCETCLAFWDGSLVVTFADTFDRESRAFYIQCICRLLQASETHRVPLVGYIDTSYAHDLTLLLQHCGGLPPAHSIHDAQLLNWGMTWGDRTPAFLCQRPGILRDYDPSQRDSLIFTYLKTHDGYPARLEFPRWIYDAGRLETVVNWIRGEVIIGSGYPYVIETADQTAVLQAGDRQSFYRLFQDWAAQAQLKLRLSRKMVSKARRR
ncbi:hypothetical protein DO97_06050 [Neosynechococcus sphagnicola sy1]|uniref:NurA domain-containing protein n=1 Tax=Neosynechococcus sphagnicola sy1 TaxID=1497020 RepID=A0A098TT03_9CYAN|nr:DNA double-strand break repair nuclease NurA [Neosynechococcus sphagnicola]KGF73908.1 hypothetical protein DO97_06050 [Neosynechococcus sphagnicola sy1]